MQSGRAVSPARGISGSAILPRRAALTEGGARDRIAEREQCSAGKEMPMFYLFLTAAVLVAADQLIKLWVVRTVAVTGAVPLVPGLLDVTYLQNTGAAWSVLQRHTGVLTVVSLIVILIIIWALAARKIKGGVGRWSLAVLLGGAVGNLIDRIRLGYVVDMFRTLFISFPVFNFADICVTLGGIVFCVYVIFFWNRSESNGNDPAHR